MKPYIPSVVYDDSERIGQHCNNTIGDVLDWLEYSVMAELEAVRDAYEVYRLNDSYDDYKREKTILVGKRHGLVYAQILLLTIRQALAGAYELNKVVKEED